MERLYLDLVDKMDEEMEAIIQPYSWLSAMYASAEHTMHVFYEYRFLLRDMYLIFREYDTIRDHYIKLQETRKRQFAGLFDSMIEKKVLRREEFRGEYERLYERLMIIGDHWINASELFRKEEKEPIKYYLDLMFEMIYPYLTEKGKEEYHDLLY